MENVAKDDRGSSFAPILAFDPTCWEEANGSKI